MRHSLRLHTAGLVILASLAAAGCATETHHALTPEQTAAAGTAYSGPRYRVVVGNFDNRSDYMRGMFSQGPDRLGSQAKTILETHLQQSGRFVVSERGNMNALSEEARLSGQTQAITGAQALLTGDVTEFGRREVGDIQLFGLLGAGRKQVAYAKVSLHVVDVKTSQIVYSVQGSGEYELGTREVIGFGGTAGYDATLNGKVLNLAITEAVNRLVEGLENGQWSPSAE